MEREKLIEILRLALKNYQADLKEASTFHSVSGVILTEKTVKKIIELLR